jgi:putative peptidoglycan lipid II flippase
VTILGEAILIALLVFCDWSPNNLLVLRFSVVMLPYVTLVCLTAFLGGILQVHHRFAAFSFTAVVLNLCLIVIIVAVARSFNLTDRTQQIRAAYWLSAGVLLAGVVQLAVLFPSLSAAGFKFRVMWRCWTPAVKRLMLLTLPLAGGAGVLQIGVMLDKGIGQFFASQPGYESFSFFGNAMRLPLIEGAAARLDLAQFMYQFPLGVFAIALATAIFPTLGREAISPQGDGFKRALRQGIEGSLFIGLPASIGMILVATPAVRLLFEGGRFSASSAAWVAQSTAIYSSAIWAFSMLHIINRGFYSIHDASTPLRWTIYNLLINLAVELPLLWTRLGESGMAVGTFVSFSIQSIAMLWLLDRRLGGLGMSQSLRPIAKMLAASALMWIACAAMQRLPIYPRGENKVLWASQLTLLILVGMSVYFGACMALGIDVLKHLRRPRLSRPIGAP